MRVHQSGNGPVQKICVDADADEHGHVPPVRLPAISGALLALRKVGPACSIELRSGIHDWLHGVGVDLSHGRCAELITQDSAPGVHPAVDEGDELDLTIYGNDIKPHAVFRVEILFGVDTLDETLFICAEQAG